MTKETYNKSVDILLDAYNEEKLEHCVCHACAVGNLLGTDLWSNFFCTSISFKIVNSKKEIKINKNFIAWSLEVMRECIIDYCEECNLPKPLITTEEEALSFIVNIIHSKGFTKKELEVIEHVFETSLVDATENKMYDEYRQLRSNRKKAQFIGLTAVLKVMAEMVEEDVAPAQERLEKIATDKFNVAIV